MLLILARYLISAPIVKNTTPINATVYAYSDVAFKSYNWRLERNIATNHIPENMNIGLYKFLSFSIEYIHISTNIISNSTCIRITPIGDIKARNYIYPAKLN